MKLLPIALAFFTLSIVYSIANGPKVQKELQSIDNVSLEQWVDTEVTATIRVRGMVEDTCVRQLAHDSLPSDQVVEYCEDKAKKENPYIPYTTWLQQQNKK